MTAGCDYAMGLEKRITEWANYCIWQLDLCLYSPFCFCYLQHNNLLEILPKKKLQIVKDVFFPGAEL